MGPQVSAPPNILKTNLSPLVTVPASRLAPGLLRWKSRAVWQARPPRRSCSTDLNRVSGCLGQEWRDTMVRLPGTRVELRIIRLGLGSAYQCLASRAPPKEEPTMEQVTAPKPLHSPKSEAEAPWSSRRSGNRLPAPCSPTGDRKQGWPHSFFQEPQYSNQSGPWSPSLHGPQMLEEKGLGISWS